VKDNFSILKNYFFLYNKLKFRYLKKIKVVKKKTKSSSFIRPETKNIFIASLFIILGAVSIFSELESTA